MPLARRPKQLTDAPTLYQAGSGSPLVVGGAAGRRSAAAGGPVGGQGGLLTGQRAHLRDLSDLIDEQPADPETAATAKGIVRRLALRHPRDRRPERSGGLVRTVPFRYRSADIDLDRTLEVLVERPFLASTDVLVRDSLRASRATVLVLDVSGSMRGEKLRIAAATVAALSAQARGPGDQLAVVAFWSDAVLLTSFQARLPAGRILDRVLRVPARGLTNVEFGLQVARAELTRASARHRTAVLLTDAVHNAGPDPRGIAARFPQLHVLLQTDGEHDAPLAADLARLGHGQLRPVRTARDVVPALDLVLGR